MLRSAAILLSALILAAGLSFAGELYQIELTDGSVLTGEVLSLANGVCTLRTEALGTLKIEEKRIKAMRGLRGTGPSPAAGTEAKALQKKMEADPEIMNMIRSLRDDPAFRKALEDPALLKAVEAGDLGALMANPAFLQLLNSSKVREIQEKVAN